MHISIILSVSDVTDWEYRLVKGIAALSTVKSVTIILVKIRPSFSSLIERGRFLAELAIGRTGFIKKNKDGMRGSGLSTVEIEPSKLSKMLREINTDRVLLLVPETLVSLDENEFEIIQLWWDGIQPYGLGATRACDTPPHCLNITLRGYHDQYKTVVEHSELSPMIGAFAAERRNAIARSFSLIFRALAHESSTGPFNGLTKSRPARRFQTILSILIAAEAIVCDLFYALARPLSRIIWRKDSWYIAYRTNQQCFVAVNATSSPEGFLPYRSDYESFIADPICFSLAGFDCVFFEEFPYDTQRGVISCAVLQQDGTLSKPRRVLERPYHLSYPFIFRDNGIVYMIPETAANKTVELYRCTSFPNNWVFEKTLLSNIKATDATLYNDGERWWMFVTVGEDGAYTWDELHLFMSDSSTGPWAPHPDNPVKCDARSARPAGPLFRRDGRLIRPTQDCSVTYGGAINLCEIETLTPLSFRESVVDRIPASWFPGSDGLHTLSASDRLEVIDIRPKYRFRWTTATR